MGMTTTEGMVWAAGVVEGAGIVAAHIVEGPSRTYAALSLIVPLSNSDQLTRMITLANNGKTLKDPLRFELGGYAAIRGFLAEIWPHLTVGKRREINNELRQYKALRQQGLTR